MASCTPAHGPRRVKKLAAYAGADVAHAWVVDPLARMLEVLRLESRRWTIVATHAGDEVVRAELFGAIALDLRALWGEVVDDARGDHTTPRA